MKSTTQRPGLWSSMYFKEESVNPATRKNENEYHPARRPNRKPKGHKTPSQMTAVPGEDFKKYRLARPRRKRPARKKKMDGTRRYSKVPPVQRSQKWRIRS